MLHNYFITALRNLLRNRLYAALNIAALGLGLTAALLALLYVRHESTYDRFITRSVQVYVMTVTILGMASDRTTTQFASWMETDFPGLQIGMGKGTRARLAMRSAHRPTITPAITSARATRTLGPKRTAVSIRNSLIVCRVSSCSDIIRPQKRRE